MDDMDDDSKINHARYIPIQLPKQANVSCAKYLILLFIIVNWLYAARFLFSSSYLSILFFLTDAKTIEMYVIMRF